MSFKFPSEKQYKVDESTPWQGSCGDSFCWPTCDSPECRPNLRLGKTKKEHNEKLRRMRLEEIRACLRLLKRGIYR